MRVAVKNRHGGPVLFTGTVEGASPWLGWHRVRPDPGYIELPPMFVLEPLEDAAPDPEVK